MDFNAASGPAASPINDARRGGAEGGSPHSSIAATRATRAAPSSGRRDFSVAAGQSRDCVKTQLAALRFARAHGAVTTDDLSDDLSATYERNRGNFRGAAMRALATAGILRSAHYVTSQRTSRLGSPIMKWVIADAERAQALERELEAALGVPTPVKRTSQPMLPGLAASGPLSLGAVGANA